MALGTRSNHAWRRSDIPEIDFSRLFRGRLRFPSHQHYQGRAFFHGIELHADPHHVQRVSPWLQPAADHLSATPTLRPVLQSDHAPDFINWEHRTGRQLRSAGTPFAL